MITAIDTRLLSVLHAFTHPGAWVITGGAIVAGLALAFGIRQVVRRIAALPQRNRATLATYFSATVFACVSLDTNWRFFGGVLAIVGIERIVMFSALEIGLIACGLNMRANVIKVDPDGKPGSPGPARVIAWLLCAAAAAAAWVEAGPIVGSLRIVLGPVLSMVMLHLALGLDIRTATGRHRRTAWARFVGELRERFMSRFGLGDDDRDALTRTRDRAASRAARLAATNSKFVLFRERRLDRAMRVCEYAHDPRIRARVSRELAVAKNVHGLRDLELTAPWDVEDKPTRRAVTPPPTPAPALPAVPAAIPVPAAEQESPTEEIAKISDASPASNLVVSIERPTEVPEWFTPDMTATAVMNAILDETGETAGAVLESRAEALGVKFSKGFGRKALARWKAKQSDDTPTAVGQE